MKCKLLATLTLILLVFHLNAQDKPLKIGYTNVEYILSLLPEAKRIESELKTFEKQLKNQLEAKMANFQEKLEAFQKGHATMTEYKLLYYQNLFLNQ